MNPKNLYYIDGDPEAVVWYVPKEGDPIAYCKEHLVPLTYWDKAAVSEYMKRLECPFDQAVFQLRNITHIHRSFVKNMTNRNALKDYKVVRVEAQGTTVLAKERVETDPRYFIESKLSDTSKGLELMVQVGKRDEKGKKVQLFVVPPSRRMGFDTSDKDFHPTGLFAEVRAIFKDSETKIVGSETTKVKSNKKKSSH
jgi:hypothetical protein